MAKTKFTEVDEKVLSNLHRDRMVGVRDIVRETGLSYSEVTNSIINLTSKIPIYEERVGDTTVYGLL